MDLKKNYFVIENKESFTAIKTTTKQFLTNVLNREALRKLLIQLEIYKLLIYGPKNFKGTLMQI